MEPHEEGLRYLAQTPMWGDIPATRWCIPLAGMTPGIPKFRKESPPERAKDNENQFFHTF